MNKVVIYGVGLIGGSFARALKKAGAAQHIVGMDRSRDALRRALELGIIDEIGSDASAAELAAVLSGADLVLLAAPVAQTERILAAILPHLGPDTVITDAGSTKSDVAAAAQRALGGRAAHFVPGHPIAGRETNGPDAAIDDLYQGKKTVLTPLPQNPAAAVECVAAAWRACGAIIHTLTPEEHDKVFAAVSHLPHLLAYALVDDVARKPHAGLLFQYAASGFRDFTRIAGSSPEMWRDISLANQAALLTELDAYLAQLTQIRASLAAGDGAVLEATYANAQRARRQWIEAIEAAETPQPQDLAE
nr:prephenate dehydrogenase/arogenate dehydrogenase family protein [Massilia sp. YIM B04103]